MFIRTRNLVLLALALMILLVALGGVSIWTDISEERAHIRACDELAASLTPVGLIHECVRGFNEQDDILLSALHVDKTLEFKFEETESYPVITVLWPQRENEEAASLEGRRVIYLAVLEFAHPDGTVEERECEFELARMDSGRWQILSRGF